MTLGHLNKFINYKSNCPLCTSLLNLVFLFKSRNNIRYETDEILINVEFSGYPLSSKSYKYTAQYHINPENNSFYINFLDKNKKLYDKSVSLNIKDKYGQFLASQTGGIRFYKECNVCRKYMYTSNSIEINHKKRIFEDIQVMTEYFCVGKKIKDNKIQVYKLLNNFMEDKSIVMYEKVESREFETMGRLNVAEKQLNGLIDTFLINTASIENPEKLIEKLDLLILFS